MFNLSRSVCLFGKLEDCVRQKSVQEIKDYLLVSTVANQHFCSQGVRVCFRHAPSSFTKTPPKRARCRTTCEINLIMPHLSYPWVCRFSLAFTAFHFIAGLFFRIYRCSFWAALTVFDRKNFKTSSRKIMFPRLNNRKVILGTTEMIDKMSFNSRNINNSLDYSLVQYTSCGIIITRKKNNVS